MLKRLIFHVLAFLLAWFGALSIAHADDDFLEPDVAFKFSARMADAKTAEISYDIADGYYMYRERFHFRAEGAQLGEPQLPPSETKFDETFQENVEIYHHRVTIRIPVEAKAPFTLISTGQGCAEKGLCYAPMESSARLDPAGVGMSSAPASMPSAGSSPTASKPAVGILGRLQTILSSGSLLAIVPAFVVAGLLLSFTPCVLPLVPIVSFIIVGEGSRATRPRAFALTAAYSLGFAAVYTALGVAAGLLGEGLSANLQAPWILCLFAVVGVIMSLAMFDVIHIQLPTGFQSRLVAWSERQSKGKFAGVSMMGAVSALVVGPCVAPPLIFILAFISQTRDVTIGGSALFSMAMGMCIPLFLVALSAGSLLPRAGAWMESVKRFFGVLMLGLALWMVSPLLSSAWQMAGWAALGLGYGGYLLLRKNAAIVAKLIGLVFFSLGLLQGIGAVSGARDALSPLSGLHGSETTHAEFRRIKSVDELDAVLAATGGKPALLDFYADWCISCKEMERFTFSDSRVQQRFANMLLLQIDVTDNTGDDKAMLKRFKLFGPPGIIFFDRGGKEIEGKRVVGYQDAKTFLESLAAAGIGG